ncbi:MAG: DUF4058 family protein [Gemmataceae bacterium]
MPLHDWNEPRGWEGVHTYWLVELANWLRPRLPPPYRAYIGSTPALALEAVTERPDVAVRQWLPAPSSAFGAEPDVEVAAILELDPQTAIHINARGHLVAAIELVSPRNKDNPDERENYVARYRNYLIDGVHLLLIDVHRRPLTFSFANALNEAIGLVGPPTAPPQAVAYRIGEPAAKGGRLVAIWQRPLAVGQPLPAMPLPLTVHEAVEVDLEGTYRRAAEAAYLD